MRIAVVTDLHGRTDPSHLAALHEAARGADALVACGDWSTFGARETAQRVADAVRVAETTCCFVFGNCDAVSNGDELEGWQNLHARVVEKDGWLFAGVGGSLPCPSHTPNEIDEAQYAHLLDGIRRACGARGDRLVLVAHQPPHGTDADRLGSGAHVGCAALRAFIDEVQPACCLTGHIHEAASRSRVGRTVLLNPGPFAQGGRFGLLDL